MRASTGTSARSSSSSPARSSAARPSPVCAEIGMARSNSSTKSSKRSRSPAGSAAPASSRSILFRAVTTGTLAAPISSSAAWTACACAAAAGWLTSMTCTSRSASEISSRGARKSAAAAVSTPVRPQPIDLLAQVGDPSADVPAVDLELGLTGAAQTDSAHSAGPPGAAAGLARQVRPGPRQPRQAVLVLGQLHLQRPFPAVRVLGEDVEDQRRAIAQAQLLPQRVFHLALVPRRALVVEDDDVGQAVLG